MRLVYIRDSFPLDVVTVGRLEIYLNGQWGTVCINNFGGGDTACRQLGYLGALYHSILLPPG